MKIENFFPDQNRHVRFLLGLYINRKRTEQGLTIQDFARQMDLTPQAVRRIENGRMKIESDPFEKIYALLGLNADDLNEIQRIAGVRFINDLSKFLVPNFPL